MCMPVSDYDSGYLQIRPAPNGRSCKFSIIETIEKVRVEDFLYWDLTRISMHACNVPMIAGVECLVGYMYNYSGCLKRFWDGGDSRMSELKVCVCV